jgi:hypothetical protein
MVSKRNLNQVFNNNLQGGSLRRDQKTDGGTVYKQILINESYKLEREVKKQSLLGEAY